MVKQFDYGKRGMGRPKPTTGSRGKRKPPTVVGVGVRKRGSSGKRVGPTSDLKR